MKRTVFFLALLSFLNHALFLQSFVPYVVVGAGAGGIIAVTELLEQKIMPCDIVWIGAKFRVGRLGEYYGAVSSNSKAARYTSFLNSHVLYKNIASPKIQAIYDYDQQAYPTLQLIIDALQDITDYLRTQVISIQDTVTSLMQHDGVWHINCGQRTIEAHKVILATGSHPKKLDLEGPVHIPLDDALDENKLKKYINHDDIVLVVGSSHSALLIMKYLHDFKVKKVINTYTKSPYFGHGGLDGVTAQWAREVLETNPSTIERIVYSPKTIGSYAAQCSKVIYAFGFERTTIPINGSTDINFDNKTGIIGQRFSHLYGIGIAFPDEYKTNDGRKIQLIGVNSFTEYAKKHVPEWILD